MSLVSRREFECLVNSRLLEGVLGVNLTPNLPGPKVKDLVSVLFQSF